MNSLDLASRQYAVPVRGSIVGINYNDSFEQRFFPAGDGVWLSDTDGSLSGGFGPIQKINPLRVLWPHYGEIIQCYIDLKMTVASSDTDLTMKLAIGQLNADLSAVATYTQEYIDASWRRIRGTDTPLSVNSGVIEATILDLVPALPKYGDANYDQDMFVLVIAFNRQPSTASPFLWNILNIHQSVTGVV